jgi:hypothetical protein
MVLKFKSLRGKSFTIESTSVILIRTAYEHTYIEWWDDDVGLRSGTVTESFAEVCRMIGGEPAK